MRKTDGITNIALIFILIEVFCVFLPQGTIYALNPATTLQLRSPIFFSDKDSATRFFSATDKVVSDVTTTIYVLPNFPDTITVKLQPKYPADSIKNAFVEFYKDGKLVIKALLKPIENLTLAETVYLPSAGVYQFKITLLTNDGKEIMVEKSQEIFAPERPDEKTLRGPLIIKIEDKLFIGNVAAARPEILKKHGVQVDINTASGERDLRPVFYKSDIEYMEFPFADFSDNPIDEKLLWEAVKSLYERMRSGKTVFVHCHSGIGRSSSLIVTYLFLFKYSELGYDEVIDKVQDAVSKEGHFILPHFGLPETLEILRDTKKEELATLLGISSYQSSSYGIGEVKAVSLEGKYNVAGKTYEVNSGEVIEIEAKVAYEGSEPPHGIYVRTNFNRHGNDFQELLMAKDPSGSYKLKIIPTQEGKFWLTIRGTPRKWDHPKKSKWLGGDIYFNVTRISPLNSSSGILSTASSKSL